MNLCPDARQLLHLKAVLKHQQTCRPPKAAPPVPARTDSDSKFCRADCVVDSGEVGVAHELSIRLDTEPQEVPFCCGKQPFPKGAHGLAGQAGGQPAARQNVSS